MKSTTILTLWSAKFLWTLANVERETITAVFTWWTARGCIKVEKFFFNS